MCRISSFVLVVAALLEGWLGSARADEVAEGRAASDAGQVARLLSKLDVWVLPQPKSVRATGGSFDLARCKGLRLAGTANTIDQSIKDVLARLRKRSGAALTAAAQSTTQGCLTLGLSPGGTSPADVPGIAASELQGLGEQGYVLHIDSSGISAAATGPAGLFYALQTLAQIATDRTLLPGVHIRDWPSLAYRGVQYDISRGQMPTLDTLKRLARTLGDAKANMLELYLEDMFQWRSHPDIAAPEAMTPEEARKLFDSAAQRHIEVHPMLQVLGHFDKIGAKPAYQHLMVPTPPGGTAGHPWTTTVDVRKPEAVAFIGELMNETCQAFPGKFVNVDITEIADYGFVQSGTKAEALPDLMLGYTIKLCEMVAKHGMRLMIGQCPLDVGGHLNGVGPVLDKLPKDIVVASYYTAEFYGGWEKDFPRLQQKGIGLFAQPWIDSHGHIMPYVGHAMDFSDITISRGLRFGAMGSVTADWGDDGHYHLPGLTWYPFLYHAASAWTGAKLDRDYFNQAFTRLLFGAKGDGIARAIALAGNINGQKIKIRNAAGDVNEPAYVSNNRFGRCYYEFFADPFSDGKILEIVDPGRKGRDILEPAAEAARLLQSARKDANRNLDIVDELLFAAKNYQAMGRKLIMRAHYLDRKIPRGQVAAELIDLVKVYESLREDFRRLWLAGCKDAGSFQGYVQRYDNTIIPCKKKAEELRNH